MTSQSMKRVFLSLCESADTPVSLGLWLRFKYAPKELAEYRIKVDNYTNHESFSVDYMIGSLLRKWKGLETGIDTEEEAYLKFSASEEKCLLTNKRLKSGVKDPYGSRAGAIMHHASRKIAQVLGPFSLKDVLHRCEWSDGATLELPKRRAFVDTKICQLPITVSRSALSWLRLVIETDPRWGEAILGVEPEGPFSLLPGCFKLVEANKVTTVPKDSTTDRVIAVEPRGNIFLQKGVGNYIRGRLRKFGIDLSKQETNQEWARLAYDLGLATIDLSSASDTVAKELVFQLLPIDWSLYLDDLRSKRGTLRGNSLSYEKFSSMGNGFTFELESLLFWALCESYQEVAGVNWRLTSVYGDDIIVPSESFHGIKELLEYCGFEVNTKKSFSSGPFYESCGKHYFEGHDVTPIYQKELLDEVEAMRMGNRLVRWSSRMSNALTRSAWHELRETYRLLEQCRLPIYAEGDDAWVWPYPFGRSPDLNHGWRCKVVRYLRREFPPNDVAMLAYSLRKMSWRVNSLWCLSREYSPQDLRHTDALENRIGYLFIDQSTPTTVIEVESAQFTLTKRWVQPTHKADPRFLYVIDQKSTK